MKIQLLRSTLFKIIHIAFLISIIFFSQKIIAQSVLLPGDVVIVTANAGDNTVDFIPLIDIEDSTILYLSDGAWIEEDQVLSGNELKVTFNSPIAAGTNIHLNKKNDERFTVSGKLNFKGASNSVYLYQKEEEVHRFIGAVGWGENGFYSDDNPEGAEIPPSLKKDKRALLTLRNSKNHQYFIRNGASGTRDMLLKFVNDPANWRGRDKNPYPAFGTSFNLLEPPVVVFDHSISTVSEDDGSAILDVAIYEHNGSRLTVDLVYDSLRSITNRDDIEGFVSHTLNFTGLIGSGVYEVKIPIHDDEEYEGTETGIFSLQNLSQGNFGDFLTHSLLIKDNEQPEVQISSVSNSSNRIKYIEVKNIEKGVVSLSGWSISQRQNEFFFDEEAALLPGESLRIFDESAFDTTTFADKSIYAEIIGEILDERGGELVLINNFGEVISRVIYPEAKKQKKEVEADNLFTANEREQERYSNTEEIISSQKSILKKPVPGWKVMANEEELISNLPDIDLYTWDKKSKKYIHFENNNSLENKPDLLFAYFGQEAIKDLSSNTDTETEADESQSIEIILSAIDENENEIIDGLEGLNLAINKMVEEIPVYLLISELKNNLPDDSNPLVYVMQQNQAGEMNYTLMTETDAIAPGAPFWILLDTPTDELPFILNEEIISAKEPLKETADDFTAKLSLTLANEENSEEIDIEIDREAEGITRVKNLNSYPGLHLPFQSFINFSFAHRKEFFSKINLTENLSENLLLPLQFSTTESGTFNLTVSAWDGVPKDWNIFLEDKKTGKEYNLRKGFSLSFTHAAKLVDNDTNDIIPEINKYEENDRFMLNIYPPQKQQTVEDDLEKPKELELHQNYPNPFNPVTTISFYLPEPEEVTLSVFNIVGQPVSVITKGNLSAGNHHFDWEATDQPSGMYIYQLEVRNKVLTRKMTLVK